MKFVPKRPTNNIPALVHLMAWCQPGDKPGDHQWWLDYRRIYASLGLSKLTHWGRVTHIYVIELTIIG